ncbi:TetR/AcrR family transcriptional regulator [Solirubrobacter phytolaccae]|uniref:TetR/AcrR family transcriptional regulator n=1 Tax=Solirubrobacter phytolaccae TaxID=1404360 RepID=A0A9X3SBC9_9ACTN|nr:TetR/AcrR family transcriptional regulator [Solirubrobacter phytolaccae]MDA0181265.1 TetR/AcrR family transcriptional regulator [Solirubrobacter phytolaccae]
MPPVRRYHHGNLRPTLLAHAEQVLTEGGELSLRELARRAGVSHAAPRRHFPDKQVLLDALALDGFRRLGEQLDVALASEDPVQAWARTYVRFATEHAALLDLMYTGKHADGASPLLTEAADRTFHSALGLFESERSAMVTFATFHGLAAMINSHMLAVDDLDELVADAVAQIRRGVVM